MSGEFTLVMERAEWVQHAACRGVDTNLFFADRGESTKEAKAICAGCPVREECLTFSINNGEHFGVWGGLAEHQRRRLRRKLNGAEERSVDPREPRLPCPHCPAVLSGYGYGSHVASHRRAIQRAS